MNNYLSLLLSSMALGGLHEEFTHERDTVGRTPKSELAQRARRLNATGFEASEGGGVCCLAVERTGA